MNHQRYKAATYANAKKHNAMESDLVQIATIGANVNIHLSDIGLRCWLPVIHNHDD
jgi:hypothetical protein